jgi:hypothetical protein
VFLWSSGPFYLLNYPDSFDLPDLTNLIDLTDFRSPVGEGLRGENFKNKKV